MAGARRRWIVPVTGAVAAVLTVWGILGVGKASTVIPEEANSTTPDAVNESEMKLGEISGGVKKYDAALYLRGKPLKDPFMRCGLMIQRGKMKKHRRCRWQKGQRGLSISPRFYRESWSMEGIGGPCLP